MKFCNRFRVPEPPLIDHDSGEKIRPNYNRPNKMGVLGKVMRIRPGIIGFVFVSLLSCSDSETDINSLKDNSSTTSLNGTWKVVSFEDHNLNTVELKDQTNSWGLDIVVTFDDTSSPNVLSGKITTNTIAGDFNYIGTKKFRVNQLNTTKVAQPVWANKFSEAILDPDIDYNISGSELIIYYDNNTKSMKLNLE